MKKIITAIGNEKIKDNINNKDNIKVLNKDIQYIEGIFEFLELNSEIDYLIISNKIVQEEKIIKLIKEIKKINKKIKIIYLYKNINNELLNYFEINNDNYILENNEENIKIIINLIKEKKLDKNNTNIKIKNNKEKNIFNKNKIISIAGAGGVGKSIFTAILANQLKNNFNKILIIDLDILNNSIKTIFRKKDNKIKNNLNYEKNNIENLIINLKNNIDLLSLNNILLNYEKFNKNNFEKIINKLKIKYDLILVDTSSECFFENNKFILEKSKKIIFLIEGNIVQIKKSQTLLNMYIDKWKIDKNKIKIIINKNNKESIELEILKNIFREFKIIGKLNLDEIYIYLINNFFKYNFLVQKKIKKEYEKINLEILKFMN